MPLIESLAGETVVTDPAPASLFDIAPMGALRGAAALCSEELAQEAAAPS